MIREYTWLDAWAETYERLELFDPEFRESLRGKNGREVRLALNARLGVEVPNGLPGDVWPQFLAAIPCV